MYVGNLTSIEQVAYAGTYPMHTFFLSGDMTVSADGMAGQVLFHTLPVIYVSFITPLSALLHY